MKLRHALFVADPKFKKNKKYAEDESDLDDEGVIEGGPGCSESPEMTYVGTPHSLFWYRMAETWPEQRVVPNPRLRFASIVFLTSTLMLPTSLTTSPSIPGHAS